MVCFIEHNVLLFFAIFIFGDMEGTKPYIICVHGNIGVGKSTYINSRKDCI